MPRTQVARAFCQPPFFKMVSSPAPLKKATPITWRRIRQECNADKAPTLKSKLQGGWNYYGVIGNSERLWDYAWHAKRLVHKWLNRRSQRRSYNWTTFHEAWERWKIPSPQIFEKPWPQPRQNHPHPVSDVQPIRVQS